MKGIILAGGMGTRLYPLTYIMSKQLLPVYDKPMIYYPLSSLMLAGIRDILIISTERDLPFFKSLLGTGKNLGLKLEYAEQEKPQGLAQALIIAQSFLSGEPCCLILGDNIFYGHGFSDILQNAAQLSKGALIFGYWVRDPQQYGILELDDSGAIMSLEEKPKTPKSNYAIPGIYFYDGQASFLSAELTPSERGELEITDLNKSYLNKGLLEVKILGRGIAWLDTGTHNSLLQASNFVQTVEERQGLKIGCIEEIAYRKQFISKEQLKDYIEQTQNHPYKTYLKQIMNESNKE